MTCVFLFYIVCRANVSTGEDPQPDGGELEDCAIIDLKTLYSMNQWNDVPCSLANVKQYICKLNIPVQGKFVVELNEEKGRYH